MMRNKLLAVTFMAAVMLAPAAALAVPIPLSGSNGLNGLGSFTGTFDYTPTSATTGTIDITLFNTSPLATGGFITAFVFNLPSAVTVSSAPLNSSDNDFDDLTPLGDATFSNNVNGAPFGRFDIGASTGNGFEGGGNPALGIAAGGSATFQFLLTGTGLGGPLGPAAFLSSLSVPPGAGEGLQPFVVRFRGFDVPQGQEGSDKVPLDTPIPEPGTLALVGLGLASLSARRLASRKH
jgi:hypothetical protein